VVRRPPSLNIHVLKGVGGPQAFSAHRGGGFRMVAQWSGHRGPPPRGAGSGPLPRDGRMGADWIIRPERFGGPAGRRGADWFFLARVVWWPSGAVGVDAGTLERLTRRFALPGWVVPRRVRWVAGRGWLGRSLIPPRGPPGGLSGPVPGLRGAREGKVHRRPSVDRSPGTGRPSCSRGVRWRPQ